MFYRPISDLHLEVERDFVRKMSKHFSGNLGCPPYEPEPLDTDKDTVLGIAGDIDYKFNSIKFLKEMSKRFHSVVAVYGNHDYWRRTFADVKKAQNELQAEGYDNVFLLEDSTVVIDDVRFIGSTLWTDYDRGDGVKMFVAEQQINDFKKIRHSSFRRINALDIYEKHMRSKEFIFEFANTEEQKVVITHHGPSWLSVDTSRYNVDDPLNASYVSELGNEISYSNFFLWHHGHTHDYKDYRIYDTRVICNPRGYVPNINKDFNDSLLVKLK